MSEYPGFGILLARLLDHRALDARSLPGTESETAKLRAVLGGAVPDPPVLCWLAGVLGVHVPDLYVIAGMEVPPDLAPLDAGAGPETARLVWQAGQLPGDRLSELLDLARSLPQQNRAEPFPPPRKYEQYPPGFGGMLVRMLAARNLLTAFTVRKAGRCGGNERIPAAMGDVWCVAGLPASGAGQADMGGSWSDMR